MTPPYCGASERFARWRVSSASITAAGVSRSCNPVVSDDGRLMAFQMARSREAAGVGHGIFLYDLARAPRRDAV
ncbi:MAG TPA: hypothetical protein VGF55_14615 [Gemmataceae bacterium]